MKTYTFVDYRKRMRRVTQRISDFAGTRLSGCQFDSMALRDLADAACWSPEHFTRMWTASTGESPLTSVRRSLLELTKPALLNGDAVSAVAERAGYSSGQAFAHAFSREYGRSARDFVHEHANTNRRPNGFQIIQLTDPIPILTAKYFGGYADAGDFSSACMSDLRPVLTRHARGFFFMMSDVPDAMMVPDCRFDFAFGLSPKQRVAGTARYDTGTVAAGSYACFTGVGARSSAEIDEKLRERGWVRRDGPLIERLLTDRALTPEPLRREYLWVPLAR